MTITIPEILIGFFLGIVATLAFALVLAEIEKRKNHRRRR